MTEPLQRNARARSSRFMAKRVASARSSLLVVAVGGLFAYNQFFREEPAPYFASDEDHFLFGSIGTEASRACRTGSGWCCRESSRSICRRPAATRRSASSASDGHEMPVGLSKVTVGFPRVGINCAVCHTASYRAAAGDAADDRRRGAVASDRRAAVPAVPLRLRVRSAVHRRHHPRRRSRRTTRLSLLGSAALPVRDHSRSRDARCCGCKSAGRVDERPARLGHAGASIRSTR